MDEILEALEIMFDRAQPKLNRYDHEEALDMIIMLINRVASERRRQAAANDHTVIMDAITYVEEQWGEQEYG